MGGDFFRMLEAIVGLVATVAIISVLVSKNAQTPAVIQASASGLANNFAVAEGPVTGATTAPNLSYPSMGFDSPFSSLH